MKRSLKIQGLLLSLVLISSVILFSLSFVSAETNGQQLMNSLGFAGSSLAMPTLTENGVANLAKWMLVFLLVLIVYTISTFIPFFPDDNPWIQWLFAIVVGILGFLFVTPEQIKLLLTNYQALAIALTTIIPLVILITFTSKLREKRAGIATYINKPLIILFFIYLVVSWWNFDSANTGGLGWMYILTLVATLIWLFFEKGIASRAMKNISDRQMKKAEERIKKSTRLKQLEADEIENLAKSRSAKES